MANWKIFHDKERMASIRDAIERGDMVKAQSLILDGLERDFHHSPFSVWIEYQQEKIGYFALRVFRFICCACSRDV